jgi:hypothetical protein
MIDQTPTEIRCRRCGEKFRAMNVARAHLDAAGGCRDKESMKARGYALKGGKWCAESHRR